MNKHMKKITAAFLIIFLSAQAHAQAFEYASNPSPSWFIMDSGISRIAAFTDTLLKGTRSLYLLQSMDSSVKNMTYTYNYVNGNGAALTFIYTYARHNSIKTVSFIEIDGQKEDLMNIYNHYFHVRHEWEKEKENANLREFVFGEKKYILKMADGKDKDGNPTGITRSAIMNF